MCVVGRAVSRAMMSFVDVCVSCVVQDGWLGWRLPLTDCVPVPPLLLQSRRVIRRRLRARRDATLVCVRGRTDSYVDCQRSVVAGGRVGADLRGRVHDCRAGRALAGWPPGDEIISFCRRRRVCLNDANVDDVILSSSSLARSLRRSALLRSALPLPSPIAFCAAYFYAAEAGSLSVVVSVDAR